MQYTFKLIDKITGKVFYPSLDSAVQLNMRFNLLTTANTLRTLDGSSERSSLNWLRGNISISGSGSAAPGFDNLDVSKVYYLHSNQVRSESLNYSVSAGVLTASSVTNILPFTVRDDAGYTPFITVTYKDGRTVAYPALTAGTSSRSYSVNVGTEPIDSAVENYFPIYEVYASPAAVDYDARSNIYGWSLELELV